MIRFQKIRNEESIMAKVLYIEASARGERSYLTAPAEAFIASYKKAKYF